MQITQKKQVTSVHAEMSEEIFNTVTIRASEIGMKVNQKKTQLLCVSSCNSANVESYIKYAGGENYFR